MEKRLRWRDGRIITGVPSNPDTNRWKRAISEVSVKSSQCSAGAVGVQFLADCLGWKCGIRLTDTCKQLHTLRNLCGACEGSEPNVYTLSDMIRCAFHWVNTVVTWVQYYMISGLSLSWVMLCPASSLLPYGYVALIIVMVPVSPLSEVQLYDPHWLL